MAKRRIGLWLIGACGGVGSTVALGLAALARGVQDRTGMVTALPLFEGLDLDEPGNFVLGGHDIRRASFLTTVMELQARSNVFSPALVDPCREQLEAWSSNLRPGTVFCAGETITRLADLPGCEAGGTPWHAIEKIQTDLRQFREEERLDQIIVLNVASTEPPFPQTSYLPGLDRLWPALKKEQEISLPASSLYALATLDLGMAYVNFTPSLGASFSAAIELANQRRTVVAGQDGKTGETLLKSVLAPMFAARNLKLLSWVGHNIFGNRDGLVLNDPRNKESKIRTKDQLIQQIVGYTPQTHVSIEYISSLDDWKTAWDHIHFQGFLGVKMIMQFLWQGCDSILAAPLAIDLVRLALFAQRRGEVGILRHLACFFKSPMGVTEHDFFQQWQMLEEYVQTVK